MLLTLAFIFLVPCGRRSSCLVYRICEREYLNEEMASKNRKRCESAIADVAATAGSRQNEFSCVNQTIQEDS